MSIKILTKNSIDNTNIDGARQNHFSAGMRSGIVKGAYNEGTLFAPANNKIALDSCELRISGHQVVIDSAETIELQNAPSQPTKMSVIAEIQVSDMSVPSFRLFIQPASVDLRQENLFKTNNGSGTYQLRIGNFTLGTTGLITDVIRTADIITGGGEGGIADIKFNATATQLSSSSQPEVNADYNEETKEWDLNFGIPAGSGSRVTIGEVEQPIWSADFAESERLKSKNLARIENGVATIDGMTITSNNGTVSFNGTTTNENTISLLGSDGITRPGAYYENVIISTGNSIKLKAGTYTISWTMSNASSLVILYGGLGQKISTGATRVEIGTKYTITFNQDVYLCLLKYWSVNSHNWTISDVQIESGDTKTSFYPYSGGQILREGDVQPYIATATLTSDYIHSATSTYEKLPITSYNVVGDKLTVKDNAIYVGNGVSKVKVSAMVQFNIGNVSDVFCAINKNENRISFVGVKPNTGNTSIVIPPFVVDTGEGNYFTLWGYIANASNKVMGSSSIRTYLTVEVVE